MISTISAINATKIITCDTQRGTNPLDNYIREEGTMGYFSQLALTMNERQSFRPDASYPSEINYLELRLGELYNQLEELNAFRPHDPMQTLYDRYFYEDHLPNPY